MGLNLTKAEAAAAFAIKHPTKTATMTECIDKDVSALAFAANVAFYGNITFSKASTNKGAEATVKHGLTTGAGQVTNHTARIEPNEGGPKELSGVLFSSVSTNNMNARFTGYSIAIS